MIKLVAQPAISRAVSRPPLLLEPVGVVLLPRSHTTSAGGGREPAASAGGGSQPLAPALGSRESLEGPVLIPQEVGGSYWCPAGGRSKLPPLAGA